ncbi:MAG TPA: PAS domain-containing protein [Rhizomicrobium sp.]|jgi:hypothetical protein|nr:PAS domain-containing protein [Rhizomicrobium sp.]
MTKPGGKEGGGEPLDYRAIAGSAAFAALDPKLKLLFEYWNAKRGTQPLPARLGLPVAELKPWIGQLAILEPSGTRDFRFRLCGTGLIRRFGREATGAGVHELAGDVRETLQAPLRHVLSARVPVIARPRIHVGEKSEIYSELLLPLSDGGESVTTILLGAYLSRDA